MASNIDATQPPALNPTTAAMRANMATAKAEIEALQTTPMLHLEGIVTLGGLANYSGLLAGSKIPYPSAAPHSYPNAYDLPAGAILIPNSIDYVRVFMRTEFLNSASNDGTMRGHICILSSGGNPGPYTTMGSTTTRQKYDPTTVYPHTIFSFSQLCPVSQLEADFESPGYKARLEHQLYADATVPFVAQSKTWFEAHFYKINPFA